jgi:hypothetical protein
MLLVVTLAASVLGYIVFKTQRQMAVVKAIQQMGGMVTFDHEIATNGVQLPIPRSPGPKWLRQTLGDEYFVRLVKVSFDQPDDETISSFSELDLSTVEHLLLAGGPLTDKGVSCLTASSLPKLRRLRIDETKVSDDGLAAISKNLPQLENLYLGYTNVGNDGIAHLTALNHLRVLDVNYTKVDTDGVNSLKAKMPQLLIIGPAQ